MGTIRSAKRHRDKRSLARIATFVETFDFDPSNPIPSETAGWTLLKLRLLPAVNAGAEGSLDLLRRALNYFNTLRAVNLSLDHRRLYNCWFVATLRLFATVKKDQGDHAGARRLLKRARRESGQCPECLAEIDRSWGILYLSTGDMERATAQVLSASARYDDLGHDGHNLNDNAPASCLFAKAAISWKSGKYGNAIEEICEVVRMLDPERSPELHISTQLALSKYLLDAGDESRFLEALSHLDRAAPYFYDVGQATAQRALLEWNRGMIRGRLGDGRAESHLEKARGEFIATNYRRYAVMVTSDLTHLHLVRHRPPRLIEPVVAEAQVLKARVPWRKWVPEPTRSPFKRLLRCLRSGKPPVIWDACVSLRELSSAGGAMPSLLPSMRFIG